MCNTNKLDFNPFTFLPFHHFNPFTFFPVLPFYPFSFLPTLPHYLFTFLPTFIVTLTLGILILFANNSSADVNFSQLSVYDEYGAVKPVKDALPLLRMEISGTTKVTNLKVAVGPSPQDVKKADLWTYDAGKNEVLSKRAASQIDDEGVVSFRCVFRPLGAMNYAVTIDVVSSVERRHKLETAVVEVEGTDLGTIKKDGAAFGDPSPDNLLNPDGFCMIDFPPLTAHISSGKSVNSGISGNEIVFECTATESIEDGGAISFTVPSGWTHPQRYEGRKGYVKIDGNTGNPNFNYDTMIVPITPNLSEGQHIRIHYGYQGGDSGVVAPVPTKKYTFMIKVRRAGGEFMELTNDIEEGNLTVKVSNAPDGSGEVTVTPEVAAAMSQTALKFRYEPIGVVDGGAFSVAIPKTWSEPNRDNTTVDCSENAAVESPRFSEKVIRRRNDEGEDSSEIPCYTITVPIAKLTAEPQQYLEVTYSIISPLESGTVIFPVESKGSAHGELKPLLSFPNVQLTSAPSGSGIAETDISEVGAGTTGNEITFTYIPEGLMLEGAAISLTVPDDWTSPLDVNTTVDDTAGAIGEPEFYNNTVEISIKDRITPSDKILIHYGAIGEGITAGTPSELPSKFIIQSKGDSENRFKQIKNSPVQISTVCGGSGRVEITEVKDQHGNQFPVSPEASIPPGTHGNSIVITYTATTRMEDSALISIEIPPEFDVPQSSQESQPGYTSVEAVYNGLISSFSIDDRTVSIDVQVLIKSGTIELRYTNFSTPSEINKEYRFVTKSTCEKDSVPKEIIDSPILYTSVPLPYPGCGTATIDQGLINATSNENSIIVNYTADCEMTADNCELAITIPEVFTSPADDNISIPAVSSSDVTFSNGGYASSGNKVTIPIDLKYGKSIEIEYGPFKAPATAGDYTFVVESSYEGEIKEIEHSPTLEVGNVLPGTGEAKIINPTNRQVFAGEYIRADKPVKIEFTAIGTMSGGGVRVKIPEQLGSPIRTSVRVSAGSFSIDGSWVVIPIENMERDDKIWVEYSGFKAPSEDMLEFQIESSGDGQNYALIDANPTLEVARFSGTCTVSPRKVVAGSSGVDFLLEFSPDYLISNGLVQIEIPADFPPPQAGTPARSDSSDGLGYVGAWSDGSISEPQIDGNKIQIDLETLESDESVSISYKNIEIPDSFKAAEFDVSVRGGKNWTLSNICSLTLSSGEIAAIEITNVLSSIACNEKHQFGLEAADEKGNYFGIPNSSANWNVEPESLGEIDDGLFTGNKADTGTIRATLKDNSSISDTVSIEVGFGKIDKLNISIPLPLNEVGGYTMTAGDSYECSVSKVDKCGNKEELSPSDVTWSVIDNLDDEGNLTDEPRGEITDDGEFTVKYVGRCKIKAVLKSDSNISGESSEIQIEPDGIVEFKIKPSIWTMEACTEKQFNATEAKDKFGNSVPLENNDVNYEVVGEIGKIDQNGLFSAETVGIGSIRAELQNNPDVTDTTDEIGVTFGKVSELKIVDLPLNIALGQTVQLSLKKVDECGNETPKTIPMDNIKWTVIDNLDYEGNPVDEPRGEITESGKFTAKHLGTCKIKAEFGDNPEIFGVSDEIHINQIVDFKIQPSTHTIPACEEKQFNVTDAKDEFGNSVPITNSDVEWRVIGDIGKIDPNGFFTAETVGTGQIRAELQQPEQTISRTADLIKVIFGELDSLKIDELPSEIEAGQSVELSLKKVDKCGNEADLSFSDTIWSVIDNFAPQAGTPARSNPVDEPRGEITDNGKFTAKYAGKCKIKAVLKTDSSISGVSNEIQIEPGPIVKFVITPSSLTIQACDSQQFDITEAEDKFGNSVPITNSDVEWRVIGDIGKIDQNGLFTAETVGTGQIRAELQQPEQTISRTADPVKVIFGELDSLKIGELPSEIEAGQSVELSLKKIDKCGNEADLSFSNANWSVIDNFAPQAGTPARSNPVDEPRGEITDNGKFTAKYAGKCKIKAVLKTDASISGVSNEIRIKPEGIVRFVIKPSASTIPACEERQFNVTDAKDKFENSVPIKNSDVEWKVTGNIGKIDPNGLFIAETVGTGQVKATLQSNSETEDVGSSATADIEVTFGEIDKLVISPMSQEILVEESQNFSLTKIDLCGNEASLPATDVNWSVVENFDPDGNPTDKKRGEMGEDGTFLAKYLGTCKIKASFSGLSATTNAIQILPNSNLIEKIELWTEEDTEVKVADSLEFNVQATDVYTNKFLIDNDKLDWKTDEAKPQDDRFKTIGELTDNGVFTGIHPGSGKIEVTLQDKPNIKAELDDVAVIFNEEIAGLEISLPPDQIKACNKHLFSVSLIDDYGNEKNISNESVDWQIITGEGEIGQGQFLGTIAGQIIIQASSAEPKSVTQVSFEVIPNEIEKLIIIKDYPETIQSTKSHQFKAIAKDCAVNEVKRSDQSWTEGTELNWSVEPRKIGEIDKSGSFTAKKVGTGSVKAELSSNSNISAQTSTIEVIPGPTVRVEIDDENLPDLVKACENIQLQAKTFDENDNETGKAVKWETDNGDIDQNGLFAPQQADPATITASYSDEISDRIELQIEPGDLHHIQIVEEGIPYQMKCGSEYEFKVMSYDACNNKIEIILNTDIEWNLTGDIGKIDQSGKLTASETAGKTGKVIADYNGMEDDTDKLINIVHDIPGRSKIVEGYPKTMKAGETYDEFKVNVYDQYDNKIDGISQVDDLDWDGGEIGTFEDNVFTAEKAVEGKITATLIQNPEIESQATVEVTPGPPVKIVVTEDYPSTAMQCGDTHSFQFSAYDKYDNKVDDVSNDDVSWEVTDKTKGTINDSGKLTVVHPGLTKVTATLRDSGVGDTTDSVINIIVDGIETLKITEDYPKQMTAGETHEFHFKAYDAFDNEIVDIPDDDINWQPVDVSIGTFDGNVFTAEKIGSAHIKAKYKKPGQLSCEDVTDEIIEVLTGDLDEITVEAENAKLVADGESKSKITIIVKDAYDNPVKNETVTVSISGVGGRLSAEELTTSADGTCTTNYIAGGREGQVEITARLKSEAGKSDSVEIELTPFIPPSPIKVELLPHSRIIAPALNNDTYSMLKIRFTRTSLDLSTELHIYSLSGRPVYESFDRHKRSDKPGWLEYIWDGRKDYKMVEDGIYIYVLKIGKQIKKGTFVVAR